MWQKLIIEGKRQSWVDMTQAEIDKRLAEIAQAEQDEQIRQTEEGERDAALSRLRQVAKTDSQLADLLLAIGKQERL